MPKIPDCDCKASRRHRCLLYARNPHLICTVHPNGVDGDRCLDFRPDPNIKPEEQWSPEGYSWYDGQLVRNQSRYTQSEQWEILNTHPFFTGVCPQCKHEFDGEGRCFASSLSNRHVDTNNMLIQIIFLKFTTIVPLVVGWMTIFIKAVISLLIRKTK